MTTVSFISAKHSPGATTAAAALGIASSERQTTALLELDPTGGDLAAYCRLSTHCGVVSAIELTRTATRSSLDGHMQSHGDVRILAGPMSPSQTRSALDLAGDAMVSAAHAEYEAALLDLGRINNRPEQQAEAWLSNSDLIVVVLRPTLAGVEHVRSLLPTIRELAETRLLTIGTSPYSPSEVGEALDCPVLGSLPLSDRDVELLFGNPNSKALRRTALMRSARACLDEIGALTANAPEHMAATA